MKAKHFLIVFSAAITGSIAAQEVGIGTTAPTVRLDIQAPATYTNDLLRVMKGAGTYLIVKNNGNVGIGTASPSTELDVNGQIRIRGGNPGAGKILQSDANGVGTWVNPSAISDGDWTVSGSNMYSAVSGNVGIGISNPAGKLEVYNTTGPQFYISSGIGQFGLRTGATFSVDANGNLTINTSQTTGPTIPRSIYLSTNGGTVGIGTATPGAKLDVAGHIWQTGTGQSVFLGEGAGNSDDLSNNKNVFVGYHAGYSNSTGSANTAIGYQALHNTTTPNFNTAIGYNALYSNTTGSFNTANGSQALYNNSTGGNNTAIGEEALYSNTNGSNNTALGAAALIFNNTGSQNTASGVFALSWNTSGFANTAIGYSALYNNSNGHSNTAVGYYAFYNGNDTNSTALGYNATITASHQVRIGNSSVTSIGGYANWTNVSDARFKTDINENVPGLDFITRLRPVTYHLDMDAVAAFLHTPDSLRLKDAEQRKAATRQTGFIAQEVERAAREIGYDFSGVDAPKNNHDFYGLRYAEFVVPLVKAIQELNAHNQQLQSRVHTLENEKEAMKKEMATLESRLAAIEGVLQARGRK